MKKLIFTALIVVLITTFGMAQGSDTLGLSIVVTKSQNRFIGTIVSQSDKEIVFRDNDLGTVTIALDKIKTIESEDLSVNYVIKLKNNNTFAGNVIDKTHDAVQMQTTEYGIVSIPADQIMMVRKSSSANDKVSNAGWFPNPNATRYLFAPSAIPLRKGEGYYQNVFLSFNSANYGITDNFSMGGGLVIPWAVFITPKIGYKVAKNFHVGGGIMAGIVPNFGDDGSGGQGAGIAYAVATYGSIEHNITVGGGYGYWGSEVMEKPIITINGMTRLSKNFALVTENWLIPYSERVYDTNGFYDTPITYHPYISYGGRFMTERLTIDAAFINSKDISEFLMIGIPYVDVVWKF